MEFKIKQILNKWSGQSLDHVPENFIRALTHWSINKKWNYEDLEYLGDRAFKYIINAYLYEYYKGHKIENRAKFLARKSMIIESELILPLFTRKLGLTDFIRYDKKKIKDEHIEFFKIEEDVFEAFIGAWQVTFGTIENIKPLIYDLLNSIDIEEITFDPIAKFNELVQKHNIKLITKVVNINNEFITYGIIPKKKIIGGSKQEVQKKLPGCKINNTKKGVEGYIPSLSVKGVHREKLRSKKLMYKILVEQLTKQYLLRYSQEQTFN